MALPIYAVLEERFQAVRAARLEPDGIIQLGGGFQVAVDDVPRSEERRVGKECSRSSRVVSLIKIDFIVCTPLILLSNKTL